MFATQKKVSMRVDICQELVGAKRLGWMGEQELLQSSKHHHPFARQSNLDDRIHPRCHLIFNKQAKSAFRNLQLPETAVTVSQYRSNGHRSLVRRPIPGSLRTLDKAVWREMLIDNTSFSSSVV